MWKIWVMLVLLLSGCADNVDIRYREVDTTTLIRMRSQPSNIVLGHSRTEKNFYGEATCTIYHLPEAEYVSKSCYLALLEHEKRHCYGWSHPPDFFDDPQWFFENDYALIHECYGYDRNNF